MSEPEIAVVEAGSDFSMTADPVDGLQISMNVKGLPPMLLALIMQRGEEIPALIVKTIFESIGAISVTKQVGEVVRNTTPYKRTVN